MLEPEGIKRDEFGDWTHSALLALYQKDGEDREMLSHGEFDQWLKQHGIEISILEMEFDLDESDPAWIRHFDEGNPGSLGWNPERPGPEWNMLSIHDTEDGPVVIWYRKKTDSSEAE